MGNYPFSKQPHHKFAIQSFLNDFAYFTLIFDLLRHSIGELSDAGFRRYMEKARMIIKARQQQDVKDVQDGPTDPEVTELVLRFLRMMFPDEYAHLPLTPNIKWAEYKGDARLGVNAGELLLRVSLFEGVMKDIHRHILLANPSLLAKLKPKEVVKFRVLFSGGFERTLFEAVDQQVRELDRMPTKKRASFYQEKLQLSWGDDVKVKRITELIDKRHKLVHVDPQHTVTDKDIEDARELFCTVPHACFTKARLRYGSHFA